MKYILLIYGVETGTASPEEEAAVYQQYFAYNADMRARGVYLEADALQPITTATTVRLRDGKAQITDGPFAETAEQLGGYYILDCKDREEAIECALKIPGAKIGSIEIRPLVVFE